MDNYLNDISFLNLIPYLLEGILLLVAFSLIGSYVIPFAKEKNSSVPKWWRRIKIVVWLIYAAAFYVSLLQKNMNVTLVLTVLIVGLGWNFWRNVFAGILIKFNYQLEKGEIISTDFAAGKLQAIHLSQSELINEKGELVVIPNSKLRSSVLKHLLKKSNIKTHSFIVKPAENQTGETIYQRALNCPFISANQKITVERLPEGDYIVQASIIDNSFLEKVNEYFQ